MADIQSVLLQHLRADDGALQDLQSAASSTELTEARAAAKQDPADVSAFASVAACMIVDESTEDESVIDAAKAAAQRAPRDPSGNAVALLAGEVVWRLSGQPRLAEPYFRRVRRTDASNADVLAFYRNLFSQDSDASQLMQVLVQARRAAEDQQVRYALAEEMAALATDRLNSPDRAIEVWRSVLREDGGKDDRVTEHLEGLYRSAGKWTALVELLKERFDRIEDHDDTKDERIAKLREIADLYLNQLKLNAMALATLQRVLSIDPTHAESLEQLAETYSASGRFNDLLGVYQKLLDSAKADGDQDAQVEHLRKIASIWVDKLGNPQRALEPLREVLAMRPGDPQARVQMADIHERRRDWRSLIALRREELAEKSGEDALGLRLALARLSEQKLGDRREAIADWNAVLEHHGDNDESLDALRRLYEREGRWAETAEVLHRSVARAGDAQAAVPLLIELGSVYSDRLRNREQAVATWQAVARISPGHERATRTLRDAYVADGRWDDLSELYLSQGRVNQLVDVLGSTADRLQNIEHRVELYRRVASLCRDKIGQPERALKALERTLAIQPDNLDVARELVPIYTEQANWARLMSTYEVLVDAESDPGRKLELMDALQSVARDNLNSPALTFQWAAKAYEISPGEESLRASLERAAEDSDAWDDLTRLFEARIADESVEQDERLLLLDKLAVIARDKLFKPDDAQRYFRRIIEIDPTNGEAMSALEGIYTSTRRWDDLSEVYRRRLEVTEDVGARLQTLRGLSGLQGEQLGDLDAAVATFRQILEIEPADHGALDSLADIHRKRGDWQDLADVLERKLELSPDGRVSIPLLVELSKINATRLSRADAAIDGYLRVLSFDPTHRESVSDLEELRHSDPSLALPIARGLLPYYQRVDDRLKEAEATEVLLTAEEDLDAKREMLRHLASLYGRMDDRKHDALRIAGELFEDQPGDWETRKTLARLAQELGQVEEVARRYETVLNALDERAEAAENEGRTLERAEYNLRRDLRLELGQILREHLNRPLDAERVYASVLDQDETHQGAYEALESLLQARDAHPELVTLYRRRVDVVFNQREQKELLGRIIEISRDVLDDRATAIATAEELLDLVPDDLQTIGLLARMYDASQAQVDREKLEELVGRWAELVDDPVRRNGLMCRRASLRMQFLGDAYGSVDILGAVLGEDPDHAEARGLLEELLDIADVQLQVAALLEPIYERVGDHAGRIRVLRVRRSQAERNHQIDEATSHLLEIARIEEHERKDLDTAFDAAREAYLMDPRRLDTLQEVDRLGHALRRESDLVEVWRKGLEQDAATDKTLRIDLNRRIAQLLDERLRDPSGARDAYLALLDLEPSDAELVHRAVAALCRLHLEAGDFIALVEAQRALLRFTELPSDQVRIRLAIAGYQLHYLRDRVGAAITWSEVLDMEPGNTTALDALEALFNEEGEWARLTQVLVHRVSVTSDPRLQAAMWRRIGELRRQHLDDAEQAIAAFQSVLALKTGRDETIAALTQLVEINRELERWPDVEEGLRRLTQLAESDKQRVDLLAQTAEVLGKHLGRGSDSLDMLKRVLDLSPTDPKARSLVAACLDAEDLRERASRILTPLYEAEQNWSALLELQELAARKQPSGRRRLQALLKVAQTNEERLGDPERAFAVLCEALSEAGDQPELAEILEKVERLGEDDARGERLYESYKNTVDHILDSDLQRRVLSSMGDVALNRLSQLDEARASYRRVLDVKPDDLHATEALEQIYLRQGDHAELVALIERRAEREGDSRKRDEFLIRAAMLSQGELGDPERAISFYERLSAEGSERQDVQDQLETLYEAAGRYRELAVHLNRKLTRLSGTELVQAHLRLGRLYGEKLEDPEEGIRHLSTALRLDPDHTVGDDELARYLADESMRLRVAEMLEPVYAAVADWANLVKIQEIKLAEADDEESRVRILLRMAQLQEEQLEDLEAAFEGYGRVFREQPGNRYVRDQMSRLANVLDKVRRFAEVMTKYVDEDAAGDDSDDVLAVVREAANLWASPLQDFETASRLYKRLLRARPDNHAVFDRLEQVLVAGAMWEELAEVYWNEAENSLDEERQVELLLRLARVATDAQSKPEDAAKAYRRVLEVQPGHGQARQLLKQAYLSTEAWPELLELLRDNAARSEDPDLRRQLMIDTAELQDQKLDDPQGAVDTLEALLAERPDDSGAVAILERIAEQHADHRQRLFGLLEPIYASTGNTQRQVAVVEWRLTTVEDPTTRHELYRTLARLLGSMQSGAEFAFRALCRAVAEPGPQSALEELDAELERVASLLEMPAALSEALAAAAQAEGLASDEDRRLALLTRAGELQNGIGEAARAAEMLQAALEIRGDDERALGLLDDALQRLGHHEQLRDVLTRRVEVTSDPEVQVELYRRLGTLLSDVLMQAEPAEKAWRGLLDIEPDDAEALKRLAKSYEASGSTQDLVRVLERRIESSADAAERRDLMMRLASIHREAAKDRNAEIDVLRNLLAENPADDDAMAALARALTAEKRWAEAADVVSDRATAAPSDERRATLLLEAARIYAGPLEDRMGALERHEQVLALVPGQEGAIGDLVELTGDPDVSAQATSLVRPHLEQLSKFAELATVLDNRVEFSQDPQEQADALKELASIRYDKLSDPQGALDATMLLIDRCVPEERLGVLEGSLRLASQLEVLDTHVGRLAEMAADPDREPELRVALASTASRAASDTLGDDEKSLAILEPFLAAGNATPDLCERIEHIAVRRQDAGLAARSLEEHARLVEGEDRVVVLHRLGHARLATGELQGASEAFRDGLDISAGDPRMVQGLETIMGAAEDGPPEGVLDALETAYLRVENTSGLANVARARLDGADEIERAPILINLAQLCESGGGSTEQALEAWGGVLAIDPDHAEALQRTLALGRDQGLSEAAGRLLTDAVEAGKQNGRVSPALSVAAARFLLVDLKSPAAALSAVGPLLEEQPEHAEGLALSVEAARASGEPEGLHEALVRAASVNPDPIASVPLWREAAEVAEVHLSRPQKALEALEQLVEADESDRAGWQKLFAVRAQLGQEAELADGLGRRAMITGDPEERRELRYRLANLLVEKLDRPEDAVGVYNDMIGADASDVAAMSELEVVLRRMERWDEVRELLDRRADAVEGDARVEVLEKAAKLAEEKLEDTTDAIDLRKRALEVSPDSPTSQAALERLLVKEELWSDLADLNEARMERAKAAGDTEAFRLHASSLATTLAKKLGDSDRAQQILNELLEVDPGYVPAIISLADVYAARGDEGAMRLTLNRAAELKPQGKAGADLHMRLAELAEGDDRVVHLEQALTLHPSHEEAAKMLLDLHRKGQRWEQVAYLLELTASRTEDEEQRRRIAVERVDVLMHHLSDYDGALRALHGLYEKVQDDVEVNRRIADALFLAERFEEASGMYGWLIEVSDKTKRSKPRAHDLTRMARIELTRGSFEAAQKHLEEAYRIDTTNVETLMTLGSMHEEHKRWQDALKIYRAMLLQNADKSGLLRRGDIYLRLSAVHLGLDEKPKAQAMLRRGMEEDPDHPHLASSLQNLQS